MSKQETKGQFRSRIYSVAADAYRVQGNPPFPPAMDDAALAVYTQALRDVYALVHGECHFVLAADHLREFAHAHGIDLTESEAQ